ncbi:MAG: rhodanese-like domain-containing protein [Alphaproteobacteria bacterium]
MTTDPQPVPQIEVEALRDLLAASDPPVVLDVRQDDEVALCRIPGSLHIPLASLAERAGELPKHGRIVVNCHHGGRSMRAAQWLRQNGFNDVANLAGGIDAWARRIDPAMETY